MAQEIRLLTADEIDVRVAQAKKNRDGVVKADLLLYKDARVDMRILDEVYGTMGWKRTHQLLGDRLYCTIEVWDENKKEWIAKQDVGTESNMEPEKGQASDAFKRAGFNWGIGRELYTAPKIQIALNQSEYTEQGDRIRVWASFYVAQIAYDEDRNINRLVIADRNNTTRYELGASRSRSISTASYYQIVKAYAEGKATRSGGDYRQTWIETYQPSADEIKKFDTDVAAYRAGDGSFQTR